MKEHLGMPHFPEQRRLDPLTDKEKEIRYGVKIEHLTEEEIKERYGDWAYATTFGYKYEVITRPDGTLTVKEKDVI